LALSLSAFLAGCVASTNRVDVSTDEPFSDTETSSKDLLTVAQQMAASLIQLPQIQNAKNPPRIAFADVKNETTEIINKNLFIEKMRTNLMKHAAGRMTFLDRDMSEQITSERSQKRSGQISNAGLRQKLGADFFLTGKIASIDKQSGGKRSTYTRYAFRLTDTESTAIVWEDDYEVKKVGSAATWDR
jgi:uncharacterized protein (TIGR02722 family)